METLDLEENQGSWEKSQGNVRLAWRKQAVAPLLHRPELGVNAGQSPGLPCLPSAAVWVVAEKKQRAPF